MTPRLAAEIAHGERLAGTAEAVWGWSTLAGQQRAERRAWLLGKAAGLGPGVRTLEIGCGTGLFSEMFARSGATIMAIDISEASLEYARVRRVPTPTFSMFRRLDVEDTGFPDDLFDVVIGSSILHHLHVDRALAEWWRVLKPGGRLVLSEPNLLNPQVFLTKSIPWLKRWAGDLPHETAFVRWRLADTLRRAGFIGVVIEPYEWLHPATPRCLLDAVSWLSGWLEAIPGVREFGGSLLISATKPHRVKG